MSNFQNKIMRHAKKQEKMVSVEGKEQSKETDSEETQILYLIKTLNQLLQICSRFEHSGSHL